MKRTILTLALVVLLVASPLSTFAVGVASAQSGEFAGVAYVGDTDGIVRKVNISDGSTIDQVDVDPGGTSTITSLVVGPNGFLYASPQLDGGIYKIDPATMSVADSGTTTVNFHRLVFHNGELYAGDLDGDVYRFSPTALDSPLASGNVISNAVYDIEFMNDTAFAAGANFDPGGQIGEFNETDISNPNTITTDEIVYSLESKGDYLYSSGFWSGGGTGITTNYSTALVEQDSVNTDYENLFLLDNGNLAGVDPNQDVVEFDAGFTEIQSASIATSAGEDDQEGVLVGENLRAYGGSGLTLFDTETFAQADTFSTAYTISAVADEQLQFEQPEDVETTLELEINRWMPFNSEQPYEVYLNETNTTTGYTNLTDVTEDANVTIYNITNTSTFPEPIVTVNNTSDTLQSYNQTGVVAVNATYDGETSGPTNLTVGNRNLTNIGIMPPSQWIPSFFEIDETVGGHGIGSSMQWILFIIFIMAAAARMFDNPWVGIGAGMVTAILIWVLGYVDLGVVLATTFTAIFLSLLLLRAKRMKVSLPATQ